jgi:hypothetical protein
MSGGGAGIGAGVLDFFGPILAERPVTKAKLTAKIAPIFLIPFPARLESEQIKMPRNQKKSKCLEMPM